jgi:hypothetical protein
MKSFVVLFSFLFFSNAYANKKLVEVECWSIVNNTKESISVRLDAAGKITNWSKNKMANAKKDSYFEIFSENYENFEFMNSYIAKNKFKILELGTSADAFMIGISSDLKLGFYSYRDLGSGNGNSRLTLQCIKL